MTKSAKFNAILRKFLASENVLAADVGADGGICEHWFPYLELMKVDAFEPNEKECERQSKISRPEIQWHPIGLAKKTGPCTLYVPMRTTGASIYPPNPVFVDKFGSSDYWGNVRQVEIQCSSYADFLQKQKKGAPNLIKLDTQGSELDILSSMTDEQLNDVICVETEVEFHEIYKGQPMFSDVHAFMLSKGFELLDLRTARSYYCKDGVENYFIRRHLNTARATAHLGAELVGGDALYFRSSSNGNLFRSKTFLTKALICACTYQFFDLAFWLLDRATAQGLFTADESAAMIEAIKSVAPRPRLRERDDRIGNLVRRVRRKLRMNDDMTIYWMKRGWPNL